MVAEEEDLKNKRLIVALESRSLESPSLLFSLVLVDYVYMINYANAYNSEMWKFVKQ